jgi:hypothetical protein
MLEHLVEQYTVNSCQQPQCKRDFTTQVQGLNFEHAFRRKYHHGDQVLWCVAAVMSPQYYARKTF